MLKFVGPTLWATLLRLGKGKRPRRVAVAYLSGDSHLRFGKGDIVIVNASERAISSGQTSAPVIARAVKRGARLFSNSRLHAKVFLSDSQLLVSSANMSGSSQGLIEAGLLTDDEAAITVARDWFRNLITQSTRIYGPFLRRILAIPVVRQGARKAETPSLLEALEKDLPVLDDFAFSSASEGAMLNERHVRKTARGKRFLTPDMTDNDWTWIEIDYEPGLASALRTAYKQRACIVFVTTTDRSGLIDRFTSIYDRAFAFLGTWRETKQREDMLVEIALCRRPTGLRILGRGWPRELCRTLTRGVAQLPALRKQLSNRSTGEIRVSELKQLFLNGRQTYRSSGRPTS
jgi:hypothetical protein